MERVVLSEQIRTVLVFADKDKSGAGQLSADRIARRLRNEGRKVKIVLPSMAIPQGIKGVDFLDQYCFGNEKVPA